MNKKNFRASLLVTSFVVFLSCGTQVQAIEEIQTQTNIEQSVVQSENNSVKENIQEQSDIIVPETLTKKDAEKSKKLDLKAVVFDPNADFKLNAQEENREMTDTENLEYKMHEALYGEVKETSKLSSKGLLDKYLTHEFEDGPIDKVRIWNFYRGGMQFNWSGENFGNNLYQNNSMFSVVDVQVNDRLSLRSMWLWNEGKDNHDFFNDCWGDQSLMYAWSKDKKDQVLLGYVRNAIGIEGGMGTVATPFNARSQIARTHGNVRALGARLQGKHKYYNYSVGLMSSGRAFYEWFPGVEFVANVGVKPLAFANGKYGTMLIGGSMNAGRTNDTAKGNAINYNVFNAYLDYEYKRWNLTAEYGTADGSNGASGITNKQSNGFAGTIGYRVTPKTQVLFRYDIFDPNRNKKNDTRTEYTIGLNYFIKEQTCRLLVNYTMYDVNNGDYGSKLYAGLQFVI